MNNRWLVFCFWVLMSFGVGCDDEPKGKDLIAAKADLTTRQLIAGLNAKNATVLKKLIVVTSTQGGPPRSLTEAEAKQLVYPKPTFRHLGAGKPGTMLLRDGDGKKHTVRLIEVGEDMRVLATRLSLAEYSARQRKTKAAPAPAGIDVKVLSIFTPDGK